MDKNLKQGTSLFVLFIKYYTNYETMENEMGGTCGMWGDEQNAYLV
jgi:hypothetical protein